MSFLKAVILDWAGTTVDFGSLAPVRTLQRVFAEQGIDVSEQDARIHMGLPKKDHIRSLLAHVRRPASEGEVENLYSSFVPLQMSLLEQHSTLIPGVVEAVTGMRERGLKIATTTGYTRAMLDLVIGRAATQGYEPDCTLVPEDAGAGRPHPYMIYEAALRLQSYPLWAFVKVGDTEADILEGRNAGTWTVGVIETGNMMGVSRDELLALAPDTLAEKTKSAERLFTAAGAHFVIPGIHELMPVLDRIEALLAEGKRP